MRGAEERRNPIGFGLCTDRALAAGQAVADHFKAQLFFCHREQFTIITQRMNAQTAIGIGRHGLHIAYNFDVMGFLRVESAQNRHPDAPLLKWEARDMRAVEDHADPLFVKGKIALEFHPDFAAVKIHLQAGSRPEKRQRLAPDSVPAMDDEFFRFLNFYRFQHISALRRFFQCIAAASVLQAIVK